MRRLLLVGSVGLVLLIVFSAAGFATGHYLITNIKQIKPSVIKQLQAGASGVVGATGAAGAVGPAGAPGPAGPAGLQGLPGVPGVVKAPGHASALLIVPPTTATAVSTRTGEAVCPAGEAPISGGWSIPVFVQITASFPTSTGWDITATNASGSSTADVEIYALCG